MSSKFTLDESLFLYDENFVFTANHLPNLFDLAEEGQEEKKPRPATRSSSYDSIFHPVKQLHCKTLTEENDKKSKEVLHTFARDVYETHTLLLQKKVELLDNLMARKIHYHGLDNKKKKKISLSYRSPVILTELPVLSAREWPRLSNKDVQNWWNDEGKQFDNDSILSFLQQLTHLQNGSLRYEPIDFKRIRYCICSIMQKTGLLLRGFDDGNEKEIKVISSFAIDSIPCFFGLLGLGIRIQSPEWIMFCVRNMIYFGEQVKLQEVYSNFNNSISTFLPELIRPLVEAASGLRLSYLNPKSVITAWAVPYYQLSAADAFACDGTFIYVYGRMGLLKIGTGNAFTIRGFLYECNSCYVRTSDAERSWLCCIGKYLYCRTFSMVGYRVDRISCDNLLNVEYLYLQSVPYATSRNQHVGTIYAMLSDGSMLYTLKCIDSQMNKHVKSTDQQLKNKIDKSKKLGRKKVKHRRQKVKTDIKSENEEESDCDLKWKIVVGDKVKRGRDWIWNDQDGGAGNIGTVVDLVRWGVLKEPTHGFGAVVSWQIDSPDTFTYRWGIDGCFDLAIVEEDDNKVSVDVEEGLPEESNSKSRYQFMLNVYDPNELLPYSELGEVAATLDRIDSSRRGRGFEFTSKLNSKDADPSSGVCDESTVYSSQHEHELTISCVNSAWVCDGNLPGCIGGNFDPRFRCNEGCDFDLCYYCLESTLLDDDDECDIEEEKLVEQELVECPIQQGKEITMTEKERKEDSDQLKEIKNSTMKSSMQQPKRKRIISELLECILPLWNGYYSASECEFALHKTKGNIRKAMAYLDSCEQEIRQLNVLKYCRSVKLEIHSSSFPLADPVLLLAGSFYLTPSQLGIIVPLGLSSFRNTSSPLHHLHNRSNCKRSQVSAIGNNKDLVYLFQINNGKLLTNNVKKKRSINCCTTTDISSGCPLSFDCRSNCIWVYKIGHYYFQQYQNVGENEDTAWLTTEPNDNCLEYVCNQISTNCCKACNSQLTHLMRCFQSNTQMFDYNLKEIGEFMLLHLNLIMRRQKHQQAAEPNCKRKIFESYILQLEYTLKVKESQHKNSSTNILENKIERVHLRRRIKKAKLRLEEYNRIHSAEKNNVSELGADYCIPFCIDFSMDLIHHVVDVIINPSNTNLTLTLALEWCRGFFSDLVISQLSLVKLAHDSSIFKFQQILINLSTDKSPKNDCVRRVGLLAQDVLLLGIEGKIFFSKNFAASLSKILELQKGQLEICQHYYFHSIASSNQAGLPLAVILLRRLFTLIAEDDSICLMVLPTSSKNNVEDHKVLLTQLFELSYWETRSLLTNSCTIPIDAVDIEKEQELVPYLTPVNRVLVALMQHCAFSVLSSYKKKAEDNSDQMWHSMCCLILDKSLELVGEFNNFLDVKIPVLQFSILSAVVPIWSSLLGNRILLSQGFEDSFLESLLKLALDLEMIAIKSRKMSSNTNCRTEETLVESTHPYSKSSGLVYKVIHLPGAKYLMLEFDEMCATPDASNYVQILPGIVEVSNGGSSGLNSPMCSNRASTERSRKENLHFALLGNLFSSSNNPSSSNDMLDGDCVELEDEETQVEQQCFSPMNGIYWGYKSKNRRWPKTPLLVPGDAVTILFHTANCSKTVSRKKEFGFKIRVKSISALINNSNCILQLASQVAFAVSKFLKNSPHSCSTKVLDILIKDHSSLFPVGCISESHRLTGSIQALLKNKKGQTDHILSDCDAQINWFIKELKNDSKLTPISTRHRKSMSLIDPSNYAIWSSMLYHLVAVFAHSKCSVKIGLPALYRWCLRQIQLEKEWLIMLQEAEALSLDGFQEIYALENMDKLIELAEWKRVPVKKRADYAILAMALHEELMKERKGYNRKLNSMNPTIRLQHEMAMQIISKAQFLLAVDIPTQCSSNSLVSFFQCRHIDLQNPSSTELLNQWTQVHHRNAQHKMRRLKLYNIAVRECRHSALRMCFSQLSSDFLSIDLNFCPLETVEELYAIVQQVLADLLAFLKKGGEISDQKEQHLITCIDFMVLQTQHKLPSEMNNQFANVLQIFLGQESNIGVSDDIKWFLLTNQLYSTPSCSTYYNCLTQLMEIFLLSSETSINVIRTMRLMYQYLDGEILPPISSWLKVVLKVLFPRSNTRRNVRVCVVAVRLLKKLISLLSNKDDIEFRPNQKLLSTVFISNILSEIGQLVDDEDAVIVNKKDDKFAVVILNGELSTEEWSILIEKVGKEGSIFPKEALNASTTPAKHIGIGCDECEECPLVGIRYQCRQCPNFDLCGKCYKLQSHEHEDFNLIKECRKKTAATSNVDAEFLQSKLSKEGFFIYGQNLSFKASQFLSHKMQVYGQNKLSIQIYPTSMCAQLVTNWFHHRSAFNTKSKNVPKLNTSFRHKRRRNISHRGSSGSSSGKGRNSANCCDLVNKQWANKNTAESNNEAVVGDGDTFFVKAELASIWISFLRFFLHDNGKQDIMKKLVLTTLQEAFSNQTPDGLDNIRLGAICLLGGFVEPIRENGFVMKKGISNSINKCIVMEYTLGSHQSVYLLQNYEQVKVDLRKDHIESCAEHDVIGSCISPMLINHLLYNLSCIDKNHSSNYQWRFLKMASQLFPKLSDQVDFSPVIPQLMTLSQNRNNNHESLNHFAIEQQLAEVEAVLPLFHKQNRWFEPLDSSNIVHVQSDDLLVATNPASCYSFNEFSFEDKQDKDDEIQSVNRNKLLEYWERHVIPHIEKYVRGSFKSYEMDYFFAQLKEPLREQNPQAALKIALTLCDGHVPPNCVYPDLNTNWELLQIDDLYIGHYYRIIKTNHINRHTLHQKALVVAIDFQWQMVLCEFVFKESQVEYWWYNVDNLEEMKLYNDRLKSWCKKLTNRQQILSRIAYLRRELIIKYSRQTAFSLLLIKQEKNQHGGIEWQDCLRLVYELGVPFFLKNKLNDMSPFYCRDDVDSLPQLKQLFNHFYHWSLKLEEEKTASPAIYKKKKLIEENFATKPSKKKAIRISKQMLLKKKQKQELNEDANEQQYKRSWMEKLVVYLEFSLQKSREFSQMKGHYFSLDSSSIAMKENRKSVIVNIELAAKSVSSLILVFHVDSLKMCIPKRSVLEIFADAECTQLLRTLGPQSKEKYSETATTQFPPVFIPQPQVYLKFDPENVKISLTVFCIGPQLGISLWLTDFLVNCLKNQIGISSHSLVVNWILNVLTDYIQQLYAVGIYVPSLIKGFIYRRCVDLLYLSRSSVSMVHKPRGLNLFLDDNSFLMQEILTFYEHESSCCWTMLSGHCTPKQKPFFSSYFQQCLELYATADDIQQENTKGEILHEVEWYKNYYAMTSFVHYFTDPTTFSSVISNEELSILAASCEVDWFWSSLIFIEKLPRTRHVMEIKKAVENFVVLKSWAFCGFDATEYHTLAQKETQRFGISSENLMVYLPVDKSTGFTKGYAIVTISSGNSIKELRQLCNMLSQEPILFDMEFDQSEGNPLLKDFIESCLQENLAEKQEAIVPPPSSVWMCSICTLENQLASTQCDACGSSIPSNLLHAAATAAIVSREGDQSSSSLVEEDGWGCSSCTFLNSWEEMTCSICETARHLTPPQPVSQSNSQVEELNLVPEEGSGDKIYLEFYCVVDVYKAGPKIDTRLDDFLNHFFFEKKRFKPSYCACISFLYQQYKDNSLEEFILQPKLLETFTGLSLSHLKKLSEESFISLMMAKSQSKPRDFVAFLNAHSFDLKGQLNCIKSVTLIRKILSQWTRAQDLQLIQFSTDLATQLGILSLSDLSPGHLTIPLQQHGKKYSLLQEKSLANLRCRFSFLQRFNWLMSRTLSFVDLNLCDKKTKSGSFLASRVACLRKLIFSEIKVEFWNEILDRTSLEYEEKRLSITIDRLNSSSTCSLFESAFDQLSPYFSSKKKARQSLCPKRPIGASDPFIAFEVLFSGENVVGEGGPYRQLFNDIAMELTKLNIFIPSSNQLNKTGEERDKFVPNASRCSKHDLALFEFVGVLVGCCLRTGVRLHLKLPRLIWKQMVSQHPIQTHDLVGFDHALCETLHTLSDMLASNPGSSELKRSLDGMFFTTTASDGVTVLELFENSSSTPVTPHNLKEYIRLVKVARVNECQLQVEAMLKGIGKIVPRQLLQLCCWWELEKWVCGNSEIDVDLLKRHTKYASGMSVTTHPHLAIFWEVLHSFSTCEKRNFIKFAWGQETLPVDDAEFDRTQTRLLIKPFVTSGDNVDPNTLLPKADTCFFNIELPAYSNFEIMKERLLLAITFCTSMDADEESERLSLYYGDDEDDIIE